MAGVAQLWLSEDELDFLLKAVSRTNQGITEREHFVRGNLMNKLRPLARGVSCDVSACGGIACQVEPE